MASAMTFFVCCGAYVLNDIYDLAADRVNKPLRPLASGRVGWRHAVRLVFVLWAIGAAFALLSGIEASMFCAAWIGLLWLYSWRIKAKGLAGHVAISGVASSGFVLGAVVGGVPGAGAVPFVLAFLFHLPREVAKGIADLEGDRSAGLATLAVRVGVNRAMTVLMLLIVAAAVAGLVPFASGVYGSLYFLPVAFVVYPLLGVCLWVIHKAKDRGLEADKAANRVAVLLKATMPAGLAAILLAGV
jgi:4-hydroxybenzoate polyprenyltransferase